MAPPDQGSGASPLAAAAALRRQTSCTCTCSGHIRDEPAPQHERRRLSSAASFSSPAASSHKSSSCESLPFADSSSEPTRKLSPSVSSASSSYESFLHMDPDCLDFEPPAGAASTRAPPAQSMNKAPAPAPYDPKRLPAAMFRTRSTRPAEWSVTSNESLFSIQLSSSSSGDLIFYDAVGFTQFPSMGSDAVSSSPLSLMRASFVSGSSTGGLYLREDCPRCNGTGSAVRKAVRFAATECVVVSSSGDTKAANATAEEPVATTAKTPEAAAGWCQFGCCWPSLPTLWWPRCSPWKFCRCCC